MYAAGREKTWDSVGDSAKDFSRYSGSRHRRRHRRSGLKDPITRTKIPRRTRIRWCRLTIGISGDYLPAAQPRNRSQFNPVACLSGKFIRDLWRFSPDFHRVPVGVNSPPRSIASLHCCDPRDRPPARVRIHVFMYTAIYMYMYIYKVIHTVYGVYRYIESAFTQARMFPRIYIQLHIQWALSLSHSRRASDDQDSITL